LDTGWSRLADLFAGGLTHSKFLQLRKVAHNQRLFLGARPALQLSLSRGSDQQRFKAFGVNDSDWPSKSRVFAAAAFFVGLLAESHVARVADVQRSVSTPRNVHPRRHVTTMSSSEMKRKG
jgi:hypothetical protein